ncbi:hypothetical protein GIB67_031785 [Kingdonia uniflora]|uniref:La-related protein 6B n=1 Tax=Kingdonia uniflora TaxID=39325 RepID=A0A7J7L4F5_9MAGN|nr:hypothetical protein GIB67_031785 [Kingdonia uniflora]
MAQESLPETLEQQSSSVDQASDPSLSRSLSSNSRLNAGAAEFVPRTSNRTDLQSPRLAIQQSPGPMHVFPAPSSPFHVGFQNYGGFGDHEGVKGGNSMESESAPQMRNGNQLPDEVVQKVLNQVEFYFSDANLATTDHLMRFISKDPEGFVPMSVVASFKKIKSLIHNHPQLATVLRNSSKLVVSTDGKKVKRQHPLTESDMEELQSRIIVAENLPEDHSYQNLMKVFSAIGCVKTIRTCQPQTSNGGTSAASRLAKTDNMLFSNKLHAFVEYESVELAEKAVAELNDERNWRSGLRVRLLLKRKSKSAQARGRKAGIEGEGNSEEDDVSTSEQPSEKHMENLSQQSGGLLHEQMSEESVNDKDCGQRRGRGRGRGKGRGRGQQYHNNRGSHVGTPPSANFALHNDHPTANKQPPGPRMPDGTKGFAVGRGKPIVVSSGY